MNNVKKPLKIFQITKKNLNDKYGEAWGSYVYADKYPFDTQKIKKTGFSFEFPVFVYNSINSY